MRRLHVALFVLAVLLLLAALPFVGGVAGDALWRAAIAALLLDVVCIMLWPGARAGGTPSHRAM
jgi:uncharacterized RDD family membrane protein YckC